MRRTTVLKMAMAAVLTVPPYVVVPPPDPSALAASAADHLVADRPELIHRSGQDVLVRSRVVSGAHGLRYVPYERTYAGLPVRGGDFVVVTDVEGHVLSVSVNQEQVLSVRTSPEVSAQDAGAAARREAGAGTDMTPPTLTVLARGGGVLAYETVITGVKGSRPSRLHVFVDARTGKVIGSWDEVADGVGSGYYHGRISFDTTRSSTLYGMSDSTRPGVRCGGLDGRVYTDPDDDWGNGTGTDLVTACVDAMHAAQAGWDMLVQWLGKPGAFDGYGRGFPMRVGYDDANAYYDRALVVFGHNSSRTRQATSTDIVMHELGHAIFYFTPGSSLGFRETGALNESTGDIFGTLTEWYLNEKADPPDYEIAETVDLVGAGPIRYMNDPSRLGDPKCFSESVRNMEVHAGAGVQNHWFYLLAEGSAPAGAGRPGSPTCNGSVLRGIGIQNAGMIYMETLNRKVSFWTHEDARRASMEAGLQLFGCEGLRAVRDAWNAVSVPAHLNEPNC
ncbi:M4 family metallopeptidase [Nonomuraea rhizosphaerae]|uniref:M4 family metallopeptidase n=1 Tax=Nonomuraea rhizosphaerae TaxID=2665663 RepID=UPI001C5CDF0E|nr:M4 family metallopeptidase [Nonomuraea rhizosphaerae]